MEQISAWGAWGALALLVIIVPLIICRIVSPSKRVGCLLIYVFVCIFLVRFQIINSSLYPPSESPQTIQIRDSSGTLIEGEIIPEPDSVSQEITGFPALSDAFVHTLQSFSMDEDYTDFFLTGRELLTKNNHSDILWAYELFISLLNIAAPLLGGAAILGVLTSLFPSFYIMTHPRRPKIVISELNPSSVFFAEQLSKKGEANKFLELEDKSLERFIKWTGNRPEHINKFLHIRKFWSLREPLIIICDAYPDNGSEEKSELINRAKAIRAICIKTDPSLLKLKSSKKVVYFLMDEPHSHNFQQCMETLTRGKNNYPHNNPIRQSSDPVISDDSKPSEKQKFDRTRMYVFIDGQDDVEQVRKICNLNDTEDTVDVVTINDNRNIAVRLAIQYPFFLPLLMDEQYKLRRDSGQTSDLTICITGTNDLALEMFKTVFWICQMTNIKLHIHVFEQPESCISDLAMQNSEQERSMKQFYNRVKQFMPEVLDTSTVFIEGNMQEPVKSLMEVYPDDPTVRNDAYASLHFHTAQEQSVLSEEILKTGDYFILCLDEDEAVMNLTTALDAGLTKYNLKDASEKSRIIIPVMKSSTLSAVLHRDHACSGMNYILPVGNLDSRFTYNSLTYDDLRPIIDLENEEYEKEKKKKEEEKLGDSLTTLNDPAQEYKVWSALAKNIHAPYKLFCHQSIPCSRIMAEHIIANNDFIKKYDIYFNLPNTEVFDAAIAWIEKRRWNAYLRSTGFCSMSVEQMKNLYVLRETSPKESADQLQSQYELIDRGSNETKSFLWKLHACLVETQLPFPDYESLLPDHPKKLDKLDYMSWYRSQLKGQTTEPLDITQSYKEYDRFCHDAALKIITRHNKKILPDKNVEWTSEQLFLYESEKEESKKKVLVIDPATFHQKPSSNLSDSDGLPKPDQHSAKNLSSELEAESNSSSAGHLDPESL